MTYDKFTKIIEEKYGNIYKTNPWSGEVSCHSKIRMICPIHGEVEQVISYLMYHDYGCPCCYKESVSKIKYDNFVVKANKVHNNKYTYPNFFFKNVQQKIIIICPIHGEFEQTINNHISDCGCPSCGKIELSESKKHTKESIIEKFKQTHGDFYDYSKMEYSTIRKPIKIICPIHGEFEQMPQTHIRGSGCQECAKIKNSIDTKSRFGYSYEKLVEIFNEKHNNKYTYPKFEYINTYQKIDIICPIHGVFNQQIHSHKNRSGCPECWYSYNVSKKETTWLDILSTVKTIERGLRMTIGEKQLRPDGYCRDTNTIYLFHGSYWHGDPRVYSRDFINKNNKQTMGELYDTTMIHEQMYRDAGYNLITLWEYDWDLLIKTKTLTLENLT